MSYVDLKHLLADLALEAVRNPHDAAWIRPLATYAAAATPQRPAVSSSAGAKIDRLVETGLLERRDDQICCRRAFIPHIPYLQRQSARLAAAIDHLTSSAPPEGVPADVVLGAALFNVGLFFEAHELLEATWRATTGPDRDFYHGIVQTAAAFYHYEKHNLHGSRTLLGKGRARLAGYPGRYLGVELDRFRGDLERWAAHFAGGPRPPDYPRILVSDQ